MTEFLQGEVHGREALRNPSAQGSRHQKKNFWPVSPTKPDTGKATNNYTKRIPNKPQTTYREFMCLNQAGPAEIASTEDGVYVAIKRIQVSDKPVFSIPDFKSDYLVNIRDMYTEDDETVAVVYEFVDVSLRNIMAASGVALQVFQIADICKGVSNSPKKLGNNSQRQLVNGLSYIHENLRLYHGKLGFDTVLLNQDGKVKIGRFKNSFTIV
jgi:serine/threonine protein kinase